MRAQAACKSTTLRNLLSLRHLRQRRRALNLQVLEAPPPGLRIAARYAVQLGNHARCLGLLAEHPVAHDAVFLQPSAVVVEAFVPADGQDAFPIIVDALAGGVSRRAGDRPLRARRTRRRAYDQPARVVLLVRHERAGQVVGKALGGQAVQPAGVVGAEERVANLVHVDDGDADERGPDAAPARTPLLRLRDPVLLQRQLVLAHLVVVVDFGGELEVLRDARRARDFARRQIPVLVAKARDVRSPAARGEVAGEHEAEDLPQAVLVADGDQLVLQPGLVFVLRFQHNPSPRREIRHQILDVLLREISPRLLYRTAERHAEAEAVVLRGHAPLHRVRDSRAGEERIAEHHVAGDSRHGGRTRGLGREPARENARLAVPQKRRRVELERRLGLGQAVRFPLPPRRAVGHAQRNRRVDPELAREVGLLHGVLPLHILRVHHDARRCATRRFHLGAQGHRLARDEGEVR